MQQDVLVAGQSVLDALRVWAHAARDVRITFLPQQSPCLLSGSQPSRVRLSRRHRLCQRRCSDPICFAPRPPLHAGSIRAGAAIPARLAVRCSYGA